MRWPSRPLRRRGLPCEGLLPDVIVSDVLPSTWRGVLLANELLDNLPMALAQRVEGGWRERWVGAAGTELEMVDADPRPEVVEWLEAHAGDVDDGGWVEVQLAAAAWLTGTLERLEAGSVVVIDYGDTAENLIPRRRDGTLRTYRAHHLGPHPLDEPGETDITADVNFTALLAVADRCGAAVVYSRQDDFLADLGLRDRLSELRHAELEAARIGRRDGATAPPLTAHRGRDTAPSPRVWATFGCSWQRSDREPLQVVRRRTCDDENVYLCALLASVLVLDCLWGRTGPHQ